MSDQAINDDPDAVIGTILGGRYHVERKLGEGGMGTVYVGTHKSIGKQVAIKCLNPYMAANKDMVERFKREARAATAAGNEHIVDVTDMGELPNGAPFIVMELLRGQELAELLEDVGPLPIGRATRIMLQICDALAAAHAKGIVHRDMKPENVFLVERKRDVDFVKVLDFGIARFSEPAAIGGGKNLTATGMTMGTPHYMSAEQAQGLPGLDHRTDIYALGVILYEMLVGETPFDAETFPLLIVQIVTQDPPLLRARRPDAPVELETLVLRCLAKNPADRIQSVEELASGLEAYASLDTPPKLVAPVEERATARPPPRQKKPQSGIQPSSSVLPDERVGSPTEMERGIGRGSRLPWIALAIGATLAVAGAVAWTVSAPEEVAEVVETPVTPEMPETPETPETPPETPETPVATEVRLRVIVAPADATIFLNDVEFPSPLDSLRPRSLDPVRLRIEREGYATLDELVMLDRDRELIRTLSLRTRTSMTARMTEMTTAEMTATMSAETTVTMTTTMTGMTTMDGFREDF